MQSSSIRWLCFIGTIIALAVVPVSASASGAPANLLEAAGVGESAVTDPVMEAPDVFLYEGGEISGETAVDLELACYQGEDAHHCFDSVEEFLSAESSGEALGGDQPSAAPASGCAYNHLFEWHNPNMGGAQVIFGGLNVWSNYHPVHNKETSSFHTGTRRAIFAGHPGGGGRWYPGASGLCFYKPTLVGTGWNDRFQSRRRY